MAIDNRISHYTDAGYQVIITSEHRVCCKCEQDKDVLFECYEMGKLVCDDCLTSICAIGDV